MFLFHPCKRTTDELNALRAEFNQLNLDYKAATAECKRTRGSLIKLASEFNGLKTALEEANTACDAKEVALGKREEQIVKLQKLLRSARKEADDNRRKYEAVLHDVGRSMLEDRCHICDRKGCPDCANGSNFRWRGDPNESEQA